MVLLKPFLEEEEEEKTSLVHAGLLKPLIEFLMSAPTHNNDLKYWCLLVVHQLCLEETLRPILIDHKLVGVLGKLSRLTFGNSGMQKLAIHSIVRLIGNMEDVEAQQALHNLHGEGLIPMLASCLKSGMSLLVFIYETLIFLTHQCLHR